MALPSAKALDNNIFFTHITQLLPVNGLMIPGCRRPGTREPRLPISPERFTLHWFPQSLVEAHSKLELTAADRFIIVEPAKHLKSTLYGGYAEDFMSLGYHELSNEAVIFVPVEEIETASEVLYPGYKGTLVGYLDRDDMNRSLSRLIDDKTPGFKLHVPQGQKASISYPLKGLIENVRSCDLNMMNEEVLDFIKDALTKAFQLNPCPEMIELEIEIAHTDLHVTFNGQKINARTFFSAWEAEGLYFGLHHDTAFHRLEKNTWSCAEMALGSSIPIEDESIAQIKTLAAEIKKILKSRKFPLQVLDYFEQKIEIDLLEYWLPTLSRLSRETLDIDSKFQQLNEMSSQMTIKSMMQIKHKPLYEISPIPKQPTASLLTEYTGTFFSAYKRQKGDLVDGLAVLPKPGSRDVQCSLKKVGILSYLTDDGLIVPDINTPMVGSAVRKLHALS